MRTSDGTAFAGVGDSLIADTDEMIPTERVARTVYLLTRGHRFRTMEIAIITGLKRDSARIMLNKISRVLPLQEPCAENGGRWHMEDIDTES